MRPDASTVVPLFPEDIPTQLTPEDQAELEASMARHPSGRARRLSECPMCGQDVGGVLR